MSSKTTPPAPSPSPLYVLPRFSRQRKFLATFDFRLFTLLLALTLPLLPGCARTSRQAAHIIKDDLLQLPPDMWDDSKDLVSRTDNLAILLVAGGASGYYRHAEDDRVASHFEGHHTFSRDFTIAQGAIGSPFSHFTLAGAGYLYGVYNDDPNTHQVSLRMLEALSLTGLITMGLKIPVQDRGPNGENLAWPSGHTASSVAFATIMHEYYGPAVGLPLYALSGFVMYERMETGEHWASDVIFGAAIGYTVAKTVADRHKPELFGMQVLPFINPESGTTGLALVKQF